MHARANKLRKQIFNGFNGNLLPEDGVMLLNVVNNKVVFYLEIAKILLFKIGDIFLNMSKYSKTALSIINRALLSLNAHQDLIFQ